MVAVNVEPKMGGVLMKELSTAAPFQASRALAPHTIACLSSPPLVCLPYS